MLKQTSPAGLSKFHQFPQQRWDHGRSVFGPDSPQIGRGTILVGAMKPYADSPRPTTGREASQSHVQWFPGTADQIGSEAANRSISNPLRPKASLLQGGT